MPALCSGLRKIQLTVGRLSKTKVKQTKPARKNLSSPTVLRLASVSFLPYAFASAKSVYLCNQSQPYFLLTCSAPRYERKFNLVRYLCVFSKNHRLFTCVSSTYLQRRQFCIIRKQKPYSHPLNIKLGLKRCGYVFQLLQLDLCE